MATISEFINKVGFKVKDEDVKKVNNTISGIKSTAVKLLGAIGIGFSLTALNGLVEEFGNINDSIKYTLGGLEDCEEAQNKILASANNCRMSYGDLASAANSLAQANADLFPLDDAATFVEYTTKLGKAAGYTDNVISSMNSNLQKVVSAGVMSSSIVSQLGEQAPALINTLCDGLGVSKDQLLKMADAGTLTADKIKTAMLNASDSIDAAFSNTSMSISDALLNIRNRWGLWLAQTDETLELTQTIAKTMVSGFNAVMGVLNKVRNGVVWLSEKLGGTENLLKLIGIVAGAIFLKMNFSKILSGLSGVMKFLSGIKLSTLAIVAVVVLLALLVEDFINFMQGNDSLIGTLLEKAGVDVDKFRANIVKIWENIKTILSAIWTGIKNVAIPIFQGIWNAIKAVFEAIGQIIEKIAPKFSEFIDGLANGDVDTSKWVEVGEVIAKIAVAIAAVVAVIKVVTAAQKAYAVVQGIVNAVMAASPITWIIMAIVALIAIIVICVKNWDKIKAAFVAAWEKIKEAWGAVVSFFKGVWDGIVGVFSSIGTWFKDLFQKAWNGIVSVWNAVVGWFRGVWNGIVSVFSSVASWFAGLFSAAWEGIVGIWNSVIGWFQGVWDGIVGVFSSVASWFTNLFSAAWEGIKGVFSTVGDFFQGVWNTIVSLFTSIGTAVGDAISGAVKGAINAVLSGAITIINGFISAINFAIGVINKIPGVSIKKLDKLDVPKLAEGGYVGANKPQTVIIGDNKREGEIVSPISKMRDTVLDAMRMFVASAKPSSSAQLLSATTSSRSIVQNVEINNEFNGDKAIQQKASKAMDKSAKDATAEMARGLAYAR